MDLPGKDVIPEQEALEPVKSSVANDPFAANQTRRYEKGDMVHMAIIEHGMRIKGTFTIHKAQYNKARAYWEYQLVDTTDKPYRNGAWFREKDLKTERKRG